MNNKSDNKIFWIIYVALFAISTFIIIITLHAIYTTPEGIIDGYKNYQTIIAGLLAVAVGGATIVVINNQVRQAERLENERRERSEYAARAVLPHALRKVSDYLLKCVENVLLVLDKANPNMGYDTWKAPENGLPEVPRFPEGVVTVLRENIELALDDRVREKMRDLIAKLQTQNSRLWDTCLSIGSENVLVNICTIEERYGDAFEVLALTNHLFDYARFNPNYRPTPLTLYDYGNAAIYCARGEPGDTLNKLAEIAHRRFEADRQRGANTSPLFVNRETNGSIDDEN